VSASLKILAYINGLYRDTILLTQCTFDVLLSELHAWPVQGNSLLQRWRNIRNNDGRIEAVFEEENSRQGKANFD
jgi:hypothetical protein